MRDYAARSDIADRPPAPYSPSPARCRALGDGRWCSFDVADEPLAHQRAPARRYEATAWLTRFALMAFVFGLPLH
jgi:hypothetical protein